MELQAGIIALAVIAIVAIVKLLWLAFHPKVHISFPVLFLAIAAFFIPILNYVLFGGLILLAVNPWNVHNRLAQLLDSATPDQVRKLIDEQLMQNKLASADSEWFSKHWSSKLSGDRDSFIKTHWQELKDEIARTSQLTPFSRDMWCNWAACLRSAYYKSTGELS